jgi:hypothetical protein
LQLPLLQPFMRCWPIYPRRLGNTPTNHENLGVNMSLKKHVLLSVESEQGVELYTGDLVVGPQKWFRRRPWDCEAVGPQGHPNHIRHAQAVQKAVERAAISEEAH